MAKKNSLEQKKEELNEIKALIEDIKGLDKELKNGGDWAKASRKETELYRNKLIELGRKTEKFASEVEAERVNFLKSMKELPEAPSFSGFVRKDAELVENVLNAGAKFYGQDSFSDVIKLVKPFTVHNPIEHLPGESIQTNYGEEIRSYQNIITKMLEAISEKFAESSAEIEKIESTMDSDFFKNKIARGKEKKGDEYLYSDEGKKDMEAYYNLSREKNDGDSIELNRLNLEIGNYESDRADYNIRKKEEAEKREEELAKQAAARRKKEAEEKAAQAEAERKRQEEELARAAQAAEFEESLRNREIEGLETVEAVKIDASNMDKILVQNNIEIAKRAAEEEKKSFAGRIKTWQEYAEKVSTISKQVTEITGMVSDSLGNIFSQLSASYTKEIESLNEKIADVEEEKKAALEKAALSEEERKTREEELAWQRIEMENATSDEQRSKAEERISTLQGELNAENSINKEFENKKSALEKEKEKKEKAKQKAEKLQKKLEMSQAIVQAIGNIAAGVAKALSYGPILGPILATVVSAAGAIQVGIMTKQLAKMEQGGLLQGKRHREGGMHIEGTNIEVEGGEYVVNRRSTAKNLALLEYINTSDQPLRPIELMTSTYSPATMHSQIRRNIESGGQIPIMPTLNSPDVDKLLAGMQNIKIEPRVSVRDINTVQEHMVKLDEWIGI